MPKEQQQEKTTNGEYERAFTELASVLYEQYRKYKQQQQTEEPINNTKENNHG